MCRQSQCRGALGVGAEGDVKGLNEEVLLVGRSKAETENIEKKRRSVMPREDGTEPQRKGPGTGRGLGPCGDENPQGGGKGPGRGPGQGKGVGQGQGRGRGQDQGRGPGRGRNK